MYDDDEEDAAAPDDATVAPAATPQISGALTAMARPPEGLFPKVELEPLPKDPVNPKLKWLAMSAAALKSPGGWHNAIGGAEEAYVKQATADQELRMKYLPLANAARQTRATQQLNAQKQQQEMMNNWNKTLLGNAATMLPEQGSNTGVQPQAVSAMAQSLVQRGQVPPQMAEAFVKGLPTDPIELEAYLRRAAISAIDPFRSVAKPEFKNVAPGASLVQTNSPGGPKEVIQGKPKASELMTILTEAQKLPPNDPQRKIYAQMIEKMTTHAPAASATIINPSKPLINELMGGLGTAIVGTRSNAEGSVATLETVGRLKDALDSGKVRAGPGTSAAIWIRQVGQFMNVPGKSADEMVANTRSAIQSMARLELDAAQAMKGQGAITEGERGIIKKAAAGDIDSMTIPELKVLTDVLERTATSKIARYNSSLNRLKKIPGGDSIVDLLGVDAPAPRANRSYTGEGDPVDRPGPVERKQKYTDYDGNEITKEQFDKLPRRSK